MINTPETWAAWQPLKCDYFGVQETATGREPALITLEEFGQMRWVTIDGDPWFVAADLERILQLTNIRQNLADMDADEKSKFNIYTRGGTIQEVIIVNKPGVYRLITASRMPNAKKFQRIIYHEILPNLRKHGYYSFKPSLLPEDDLKPPVLTKDEE